LLPSDDFMQAEDEIRLRFQHAFSLQKRGAQVSEDRWRPSADGIIYAVSDGASVSFDSATWAELLVCRFVDNPGVSMAWLQSAVAEYQRRYDRNSMAWMQQGAFDRGSFATLLGLVFSPDFRNARVIAIGDSLFAFIDGDELVRTIPYVAPTEFDQAPHLLSTNPLENRSWDDEGLSEAWQDLNIGAHEHPSLLLMTDAIGRWMLEEPCDRVPALVNVSDAEAFARLIDQERAEGRMRNDDVTLVVFGTTP
jgi:hypothetical protein